MVSEGLMESGVRVMLVNGPSGDTPEVKLLQYFFGYARQKELADIVERTAS